MRMSIVLNYYIKAVQFIVPVHYNTGNEGFNLLGMQLEANPGPVVVAVRFQALRLQDFSGLRTHDIAAPFTP